MTNSWLLGLDLGGSGARALLVSTDGEARITSRHAYAGDMASADLDLNAFWRATRVAVLDVMGQAGVAAEAVVGIGVTSVRFATVVVGEDERVVLAASNRDARAIGEAIALAGEHGESLLASGGRWPGPLMGASRLRWLAGQGVESSRIAVVASLGDWLVHRLTGNWQTDPTHAAATGLFDLSKGSWSDAWIDRLGWPRDAFPAIAMAGSVAGGLLPEIAHDWGLPASTPVALAGGDSQCAALGVGALEPGDRVVVCGTTLPVLQVAESPQAISGGALGCDPHGVRDRWLVESSGGLGGESLDWIGQVLAPDSGSPGATVLGLAEGSLPGARGVLARLGGEPLNARDLTVPLASLHFSSVMARPECAPADWSRAAVENLAYGVRANLEALDGASLRGAGPVRLAGGMTRSTFWNALVASVLGRSVEVAVSSETSALGAAVCAGVGSGVFPSLEAGALALAGARRTVSPWAEHTDRYATLYRRWQEHGEALEASRPAAQQHAIEGLLAGAPATSPLCSPLERRPNILVTADLDAESLAALEAIGDVTYAPFRQTHRLLTGPDLVAALAGVEIFVTEIDVVDVDALAAARDLRVIATCRGDAVNVSIPAATLHGVPVLHAPGRNAESVADLTLAFLLALFRKLIGANAFLRDPNVASGDLAKMGQAFALFQGHELAGKTIGLVGLGAVGRAVARRLQGFGCRVLVHDPFLADARVWQLGVEPVSLDALLGRAEAVSLHAAVTDQSRSLLDASAFAKMRPGAVLVNTARAALVDEAALLAALESGQLAGAALDVFALEPPGADHPLLAFDSVLATPHVGGNTLEIGAHQGRIIAEDLARMAAGERPAHVLDASALEAFDWADSRPVPSVSELDALAAEAGPAVSDTQREATLAAPAPMRPPHSPTHGAVGEAMVELLTSFAAKLEADAELNAFAETRDVTLFFELTDLPIAFRIRLVGSVEAGLAERDATATVVLRMRAEILDGMFTGRINPMQEAMGGGIAFTGDAAKAMTIQHIQADLERCYVAAREEVGEPGDLAALGEGVESAAATDTPRDALRASLVQVVGDLYDQSLVTATGGNVSARIADCDEIWITPSQLFKGDLRAESLVRIGLDGEGRDRSAAAPSSERMMHCAAYRAKPEAQAVIHAHAPHATILANAELPFLPISTEAAWFGDIPRIPFIMPGSDALASAIEEALADSWAVLMKNHGLLVAGRSLRRAADMAEIIDRSAEIMLGCWAVGREPPVLPEDVVAELQQMGDLVA